MGFDAFALFLQRIFLHQIKDDTFPNMNSLIFRFQNEAAASTRRGFHVIYEFIQPINYNTID